MFRLSAVLLTVVISFNAKAGFDDGNSLHENCQASDDYKWFLCIAYIKGTIDASNTFAKLACIPPNATAGQLRDIVSKWLRENPEYRSSKAATLVLAAIKEAFPTTKMWRVPPVLDGNEVKTPAKYTHTKQGEGEWVGTCNSEYVNDFDDFFDLWWALPVNYPKRSEWFAEYFD